MKSPLQVLQERSREKLKNFHDTQELFFFRRKCAKANQDALPCLTLELASKNHEKTAELFEEINRSMNEIDDELIFDDLMALLETKSNGYSNGE